MAHVGPISLPIGALAGVLFAMLAACSGPGVDGGLGAAGGVGGLDGAGEVGEPVLRLSDVAFMEGLFVAVGALERGDQAEGVILESDDGEHWSQAFRGGPGSGWDSTVVGGGGRWVAIQSVRDEDTGVSRAFALTSDGDGSWNVGQEELPFTDVELVWTGSTFLAATVGPADDYNMMPVLWESVSGDSWNAIRLSTSSWGYFASLPIAVGPGAVVLGGNNRIGFSTDGARSWQWVSLADLPEGQRPRGDVTSVFWDGFRFGATATHDCCFGEVEGAREYYRLWSDDGLEWMWEESDYAFFGAVVWSGDMGVAIDWDFRNLMHTDSAGDWVGSGTGAKAVVAGESVSGPRFVAIWSKPMFSDDGVRWHGAEVPTWEW